MHLKTARARTLRTQMASERSLGCCRKHAGPRPNEDSLIAGAAASPSAASAVGRLIPSLHLCISSAIRNSAPGSCPTEQLQAKYRAGSHCSSLARIQDTAQFDRQLALLKTQQRQAFCLVQPSLTRFSGYFLLPCSRSVCSYSRSAPSSTLTLSALALKGFVNFF